MLVSLGVVAAANVVWEVKALASQEDPNALPSASSKAAARYCSPFARVSKEDRKTLRALGDWSKQRFGQGGCAAAFANLSRSETLELEGKGLTTLKPLEGFFHLKRLYLSDNALTEINSLRGFARLENLELRSNPIQNWPQGWNPRLRVLNLSSTKIKNYDFLKDQFALIELHLHGQNLAEIPKSLFGKNLRSLGLTQNRLTEITKLSVFPELRFLYLTDNLIEDFSPLGSLEKLELLHMGSNPGQDAECPGVTAECVR